MRETKVPSLGREDSPGEGNGYPLQYSSLENPMDRGAWLDCSPWGREESAGTDWATFPFTLFTKRVVEPWGPEPLAGCARGDDPAAKCWSEWRTAPGSGKATCPSTRQLLRDQPPSRKRGAAWLSGPRVRPAGCLRPPSIVRRKAFSFFFFWSGTEINRCFLNAVSLWPRCTFSVYKEFQKLNVGPNPSCLYRF